MEIAFQYMEEVRITSDVTLKLQQKERCLRGETGFVVGWTDPHEDGSRDYAVHLNAFGETVAVPGHSLQSLGRIADPSEIVSRSRAKGKRRGPEGNGSNGSS